MNRRDFIRAAMVGPLTFTLPELLPVQELITYETVCKVYDECAAIGPEPDILPIVEAQLNQAMREMQKMLELNWRHDSSLYYFVSDKE